MITGLIDCEYAEESLAILDALGKLDSASEGKQTWWFKLNNIKRAKKP